jgi:outer membrane protein assembly factor BamB
MHSLCFVLIAFVFGDWPQFRGPDADGHANATPVLHWSDTENVVWKTPIPGLGWSSPVIVEGKVFLTTAVAQGEGLSLRALAIDAITGKIAWDREVFAVETAPSIHAKNSHASPTPIIHNAAVYVHFGALGMAKLAASDGTILWTSTKLDYPPMHGSGGSPVLHDGKLVIVCDGSVDPFVAAVDSNTGDIAWKTPRSIEARISHSFVTANVTNVDGQLQVLAPGPEHFAAYDLSTGKELWRVLAPGWSVVPQPVLGHGMVFYNHDYDNPELMAVKLGGSGDVTDSHVVWRIRRGAPSTPTPVLVGDELYFVSDNGIASCVNAITGETHWMERLGGNYSASPIYVNGNILFLNESGEATWIEPGTSFNPIAKNEVTGRTFATPAFTESEMYLRTDEFLLKIAPPLN